MLQKIICFIAYIYINIVYYTTRWSFNNKDEIEKLISENKSFIIAFWHGRLLLTPKLVPKSKDINVLISNHKDGEYISGVMNFFNFKTIRGSTSKNSISATKNILKLLNNNKIVAITPDGPRGPRMRSQGKMIEIAKKMNVPIIPVTYSTSRCKVLKSWDRFLLSLPFSKGSCYFADAIYINKDDNIEKRNLEFENILNQLTKKADSLYSIDIDAEKK